MPWKYADVDEEYEYNQKLKKEDVHHLHEWVKKQAHLPHVRDIELIFFLRSCSYRIEKAKVTIDNYYTLRCFTDVFIPVDLERLKSVVKGARYVLLPKLTPEGYQILYVQIHMDSNEYTFVDHISYIDCISKLYLLEKGSVEGLVAVINLDGFSFGHLTRIPLSVLKKYSVYLQEGLPLKLMNLHFINGGTIAEKIFSVIKPMVKKELLQMMHVHGNNLETLYQFIPLSCLPEEMGGHAGSLSELHEQQSRMVTENIDFLKSDEKAADESKRVHKSNLEYVFGVDGSFKKLEID